MNLVVAVDQNWGIGYQGTQPVVIPADRKHFRDVTNGGAVIVGRKTLADFPGGKPLKNRTNYVLSTNPDLEIEGAHVVHTLDELFAAIRLLGDGDNVYVIGGDSIYRQLLPYCTYAYLTKIEASPESDSFFPNLDADPNWSVCDPGEALSHEGIGYRFMTYQNCSPKSF